MTDIEIWKPIPEYETRYEASTHGRVRAVFKWGKECPRIMTPLLYTKGYYKYQLGLGKGSGTLALGNCAHRDWAHRIIFRTFRSEIPEGMTVNHIDGDKTNNRPENLELATHAQQHAHAREKGLARHRKKGRIVAVHITEADVREIRRCYAAGEMTLEQLGGKFDTRASNIRWIVIRRSWKHVK